MFNWEMFKGGYCCVFINNKEQLLSFLSACEERDILWFDQIKPLKYHPNTPCVLDCEGAYGKMRFSKALVWGEEPVCSNENEENPLYFACMEQLSKQNKKYKKRIKKIEELLEKDELLLKYLMEELEGGEYELD